MLTSKSLQAWRVGVVCSWEKILLCICQLLCFSKAWSLQCNWTHPEGDVIAHTCVSLPRNCWRATKHDLFFLWHLLSVVLYTWSGIQEVSSWIFLCSQMFNPFLALRQQQQVTQDITIMNKTNNMKVSRIKKPASSMPLALGRFCNLSHILLRRLSDSSLASILSESLLFPTLWIVRGKCSQGKRNSLGFWRDKQTWSPFFTAFVVGGWCTSGRGGVPRSI